LASSILSQHSGERCFSQFRFEGDEINPNPVTRECLFGILLFRLCSFEFESDIPALAQKNGAANTPVLMVNDADPIWRQCNCFITEVIACGIYISDIRT
jgi:hypothetical protein